MANSNKSPIISSNIYLADLLELQRTMHHKTHYSTVTEALSKLRSEGFMLDFNLEENCIVCNNQKFSTEDFEIVDVYRYEGNSDPADEATVYAIASTSGLKGVLVTGYGVSNDTMSSEILRKLRINQ